MKKYTVDFRLYPISCRTGVCANGDYETLLRLNVDMWAKKNMRRRRWAYSSIREGYDKCPEGYKSKYISLKINLQSTKDMPNEIIWIENK